MKPNYASVEGEFTPEVKNGDFVVFKQEIGMIHMAGNIPQIANSAGEIFGMLSPQHIDAGKVLCSIQTDSVNWKAATHALLFKKLIPKSAKKSAKKKVAKKKAAKKPARKAAKKSAKKSVKKIARKQSRK